MALTTYPAAEVQKRFGEFQDRAIREPIIVSKNGRPKTVLVAYDEFVRLKERDRRAHSVADLPDDLAAAILEAKVSDELA